MELSWKTQMKYPVICFCMIAFCFGFVLQGRIVSAGTLSLQMDLRPIVASNRIDVSIKATNHGTEAAYKIHAVLKIFGKSFSSDILKKLETGAGYTFRFKMAVPAGIKGTFPLIGEIVFHDAGQQPYSALAGAPLELNGPQKSNLAGIPRNPFIDKNRNFHLRVINPAPRLREITATLYLPLSLDTDKNKQKLTLGPRSYREIDFSIKNRYGINADATYPIYFTLEFDEDGMHQVHIITSAVQIVRDKNWFVKTRWYWLGGGIFILLGWIVIGVRGKKEGQGAG